MFRSISCDFSFDIYDIWVEMAKAGNIWILMKRWLGLGFRVLPALQNIFAASTSFSDCINTPNTRSCWLPGYDINTDYTRHLAPPGKLVEVNHF